MKPVIVINTAANRSILGYRNQPISMRIDGEEAHSFGVSNLSVIKNPNISGSYRYDQPIADNDGRLGLNYCADMGKGEMIRTLFALEKGQFTGRKNCHSRYAQTIDIQANTPLALETDGEVCLANRLRFSIVPNAIQLV